MKLDAATLRSVVRSQKRRMKKNARYWPHDEWVFMESFLKRLIKQAQKLEAKQSLTRKPRARKKA